MKITRIFDLMEHCKISFPDNVVMAGKTAGKWIEYKIDEYMEYANQISYGLLALGLKPGDKVATISNNRPEWNFLDMGIAQAGMVHVPIYSTLSVDDYRHIFSHSETKILIVSDKITHRKMKPLVDELPGLQEIYTINEVENAKNWTDIVNLGRKSEEYYAKELQEIKAAIKTDEMVTLIYTSGTTGLSKGVMLSHNNLLSNAFAASEVQHLDNRHKVLSFLPLSHVFERMVNYKYQFKGISIYYAENIGTVGDNIRELKVDGFIAVPRLLEAVLEKIMDKGRKLPKVKKAIFDWAVNLGFQYDANGNNSLWYRLRHKVADKLIFSKWREALSPNITFIGCGGSALQPRLAKVFWAAGLPVFEGYGLTETSPIIAVNYKGPGKTRLGSVGPVLKGVEVKIAGDGEILCKGPNVMLGYYKDEEKTKEVIDDEGWLHTGDIGELSDDNFLRITDRKKEIFKMSSGKYIAPQVIENTLKESKLIGQLMIVGENKRFAGAIISPNFEALKEWCRVKKIQFEDHADLVQMPKVIEKFQDEIKQLNKRLAAFEQVKKFKLVCEEWTTLSGELSPTLKLKRKVILQKYNDLVDQIYSQSNSSTSIA